MAAISLGPEYYWNEANYVQNVTISGNTLTGAAHWPEMMDKKSPISLSNCKSVTLRGNSVVNASVYRATLVEVGTNVTGLQGREEVWKSNFTGPTPPAPSTPRS